MTPDQARDAIPEDIMQAAENCIPVGLDGNHYRSTLRQYIASAILSERSRHEAEIEALRLDVELARDDAEGWRDRVIENGNAALAQQARAEAAEAEVSRLTKRLEEAEKVIEPFAAIAEKHHSGYPDEAFSIPIVRVGHLRAARRWQGGE